MKLKILKLSRDSRYLQTMALKLVLQLCQINLCLIHLHYTKLNNYFFRVCAQSLHLIPTHVLCVPFFFPTSNWVTYKNPRQNRTITYLILTYFIAINDIHLFYSSMTFSNADTTKFCTKAHETTLILKEPM